MRSEFKLLPLKTGLAPGTITSVAGRYAKALFEVAREEELIEKTNEGLRLLCKTVRSSNALADSLKNPGFSSTGKSAVLAEICTLLKAPDLLHSFIVQLMQGGRINYLSRIAEIFRNMVIQAREEIKIEVTSRVPLTQSQRSQLKDRLKQNFRQPVHIDYIKNSGMLGGIKIRIGQQVLDASLSTQLDRLAVAMKGNL